MTMLLLIYINKSFSTSLISSSYLPLTCSGNECITSIDKDAGVGDYYEPFAAQEIFDNEIVKKSLKIEIFAADHTAFSKKLNKVVMMRDVDDHSKDDFVLLSGTKVREMLSNGEDLPAEFARKEVADILKSYYQSLKYFLIHHVLSIKGYGSYHP